MTRLVLRFVVEGFHCWPDAPEQHAFLRARHRHRFHFTVRLAVEGDRVVEFIDFARTLQYEVTAMWGAPAEFQSYSCEAIAGWMLGRHGSIVSCEVSEDGEHGAEVSRGT